MTESERLSSLVGQVYDAVLDPTLWPKALEESARFVSGSAAGLYWQNPVSKTGNAPYTFGLEPHYVRLYFDQYIKLNPVIAHVCLAKIGETFATIDFYRFDEFVQTRFYKEWAQPQGFIDSVGAVLDRSGMTAAGLVVFRHQRDGMSDDETRRRMRLIVPHVRRAVLIDRVIDLHSAEAMSFAEILDGISAGLFLVDRYSCGTGADILVLWNWLCSLPRATAL